MSLKVWIIVIYHIFSLFDWFFQYDYLTQDYTSNLVNWPVDNFNFWFRLYNYGLVSCRLVSYKEGWLYWNIMNIYNYTR